MVYYAVDVVMKMVSCKMMTIANENDEDRKLGMKESHFLHKNVF